MKNKKAYLFLLYFTLLWSFFVVSLGAYTRLTEAGLGCPDWPGCYGFLTVPASSAEIEKAISLFPDVPFETEKAWNEMLHRYIAGILGCLIAVIAFIAWKSKDKARFLPTALLLMVLFQATLGMWTVTMQLMPIVVMGHLVGGFTIVSLLFALIWQESRVYARSFAQFGQSKSQIAKTQNRSKQRVPMRVKALAIGVVIIIAGQIMLGGWVSANYAALVCTELPICEVDWQAKYDIDAFDPISPQHSSYQYGVLNFDQRVTIHATHRLGAFLVTVMVIVLAFCLRSYLGARLALLLLGLLSIQIVLGITNILSHLPLTIAVLHHIFGLILLLFTLWLTLRLWNLPSTCTQSVLMEKARR